MAKKKKLSKKALRAIPVSKIVVKRDADFGEYQVRVYRGSHLDEGSTYHASDKQEAMDTMAAMKREHGLAGLGRKPRRPRRRQLSGTAADIGMGLGIMAVAVGALALFGYMQSKSQPTQPRQLPVPDSDATLMAAPQVYRDWANS